jgi:hypothetical protein
MEDDLNIDEAVQTILETRGDSINPAVLFAVPVPIIGCGCGDGVV